MSAERAVESAHKWGLKPEVIDRINDVFAHYPQIESVVLYGSRAKGNFRRGSDIDLAMLGNRVTWQDLQAIELALDDLLLPYKLDLALFSQIDNDALREHIERVGQVFYPRAS